MPRFGETVGTIAKGTRAKQAKNIRSLRNEMGRKKARATLIGAAKTHVKSMNEATRQKKLAAFRAKNTPTVTKSPRWRKRGGGKVTVRSLPILPKNLQKKPS